MPQDGTNNQEKQGLDAHQFGLTVFPNNRARTKTRQDFTLPSLARHIRETRAKAKDRLPLVKMADFGDVASGKGCLRTNANMGDISGIEIEHDAGTISVKQAVRILREAGLRCLVYTTPSHVPVSHERWRVLLPLSRAMPRSERRRLVGMVNALFDGKLARESFTLSQAFYFGSVDGGHAVSVTVLDGEFIDEIKGLTPVYPAPVSGKGTTVANGGAAGHTLEELDAMLAACPLRDGEGWWHIMLTLTSSYVTRGWKEADIIAKLAPKCRGGADDPQLIAFIESAQRKFGRKTLPAGLAALVGGATGTQPIAWDYTEKNTIRMSMPNAARAMQGLGLTFKHDTFHNKMWIEGEPADHVGEINDTRLRALRLAIYNRFRVDFGEKPVREAAVTLAEANRFDPVADMLAACEAGWDGVERIDRMAVDYFNAEDTPLNRAFVRLLMIAAVRRVRQPGCKFDTILVMESKEGWNKSSAWRVLAGEGNFSDESIMGHDTRFVQEQLADVWILECAELAGITKREIEMVTTFLSRQEDRARPAYGHFLISQPRHSVLVGTTNETSWMPKQSGNRRFWPLRVLAPINLAKLKADRLQLWGEAARLESAGEDITLPEELRADAGNEQDARRIVDPWEDVLCKLVPAMRSAMDGKVTVLVDTAIVYVTDEYEFVASADIFEHALKRVNLDGNGNRRVKTAMERLGWVYGKSRASGIEQRGYRRELQKRSEKQNETRMRQVWDRSKDI